MMEILFALIAAFTVVNVILLAIIIGKLRDVCDEIRLCSLRIDSDIRKAHPKAFDRYNKG